MYQRGLQLHSFGPWSEYHEPWLVLHNRLASLAKHLETITEGVVVGVVGPRDGVCPLFAHFQKIRSVPVLTNIIAVLTDGPLKIDSGSDWVAFRHNFGLTQKYDPTRM